MLQILIQKQLSFSDSSAPLDVQLNIEKGNFVTLYGKSGAGKTSILRMLAGLMKPDNGQIKISDATWFDSGKKIDLSPQQRNIGFVFQDYALFPNMTVQQNLEFALRKGQNKQIIDELIEVVELNNLRNRKPKTLSGGQQQRVALARALVQQPKLLLLDEPLSALDSSMRTKLQEFLLEVHQRYNLTTILVSHDEAEVARLSDTIVVLEQGKVIQIGKPSDIFQKKTIELKGLIKSIIPLDGQFKIVITVGENQIEVIKTSIEGLEIGQSFAFNIEMR